ncbi:MAG TPA: sigma-70 family RNA polymerase sigma factor, partial [Acidimicrobiales bacterium]|nr:sigma-70 family RNA polymerase sigma factor [Acidimicrobiales bacterium]
MGPAEDIERAELRSVIDEEVGQLPERYRMPLILCYLEGLRHEEVARRLGCPVGTIESRLSRARERLRTRLTRRGLAPTASMLGAVLQAGGPLAPEVPLSAVQATIAATAGVSPAALGRIAFLGHWLRGGTLALSPPLHAGLAASTALVGAGLLALGFSAIRAGDEPRRAEAEATRSTATAPVRPTAVESRAPAAPPRAIQEEARTAPALEPTCSSSAYAPPLSGITLDGRLDDWPPTLARHLIDKLLAAEPSGQLGDGGLANADLSTSPDLSPSFSVGYDPKEQLLYLAVIVRDDKVVVGHSSHLDTDAVEVYVDGLHSDRRVPLPAGEAYNNLDPAYMPVLQYVAIPGKGMIYGVRQ